MAFSITRNVKTQRDEQGRVRKIHHPRQAYDVSQTAAPEAAFAAGQGPSARQLADEYLRDVLPIFNLQPEMADGLRSSVTGEGELSSEGSLLRFEEEKAVKDQTFVSYTQTALGLRVWRSGITVKLVGDPPRVIGSQSSAEPIVGLEPPSPEARFWPESMTPEVLRELLDLTDGPAPVLNDSRLWIYRFDAEDRGNGLGMPEAALEYEAHVPGPVLDVPELPSEIESGRFYVAAEVLFTLSLPGWSDLNWGAFIEPTSGAVLRLDCFVGCVDCMVYLKDPYTKTGNDSLSPLASATVLNTLRDEVTLDGLVDPPDAAAEQELQGELVHVRNFLPPDIHPPTEPKGQDFNYSVPTDDFAAVNAYYHCDRLFRLVEEMGFDLRDFFDGTTFPVRVDHRVAFSGNPLAVNAQAPGNTTRNGSDGFRFAMVAGSSRVGMAVEWRVILHEFGHTILWDHVNSPNFRFAHSPGDSLAAILNDPGSQLVGQDRFVTFPWTPIQRRHDRRPEDGWGWGGRQDDRFPVGDFRSRDRAGYVREQILSSTLFRLYRALGGDHTDVDVQEQAARYTTYLIFSAVGALTAIAPPRVAEDFADELMDADFATFDFEGWAGGTAHKVVRWAFERQGMYQSVGAPVPTIGPGAPPEVDVYLDDGRGGHYEPTSSLLFATGDIWNRLGADQGEDHQAPVAGQDNFLYIRARNRGMQPAEDVTAEIFTSSEPLPRTWPQSWRSLGELAADGPIPGRGQAVLGPFRWRPDEPESLSVLVSLSCPDDPSNLTTLQGAVDPARLAHGDNNIAGRSMNVAAEPEENLADSLIQVGSRPLLDIPDADFNGIVDSLRVDRAVEIGRLRVSVTVRHPWRGDLMVSLRSPSGTATVLYEGRRGDFGDDLVETYDSETDDGLGALVGSDASGAWNLRVVDRTGRDQGFLQEWSLEIEPG